MDNWDNIEDDWHPDRKITKKRIAAVLSGEAAL